MEHWPKPDGEPLGPRNRRVVELARRIKGIGIDSRELLLEGERTVGEALDAGLKLTSVIVAESHADAFCSSTLRRRLSESVEILVLTAKAFERLAPAVTPQPILAIAVTPKAEVPEQFGANDFALVLIDVGDPGNVGTLIRVADATKATCVLVIGGADPGRPKVIRSSAGSVLRVPVVRGDNAVNELARLRTAGAKIVASDARLGVAHDSGVLSGPLAIVLGSESHGLDRSLDSLVDEWVHIKMPGNAESLNVAMAGTLLAYEAAKSTSST